MKDLFKKLLIMVMVLSIVILVASAILAFLMGWSIQGGFISLIVIVACIVGACNKQYQQTKNIENLQASQIEELMKRAIYQALSTGAWGTQLQTINTLEQMRYSSSYNSQTNCLIIRIEMATKNRAPLPQVQKYILQQAICADLQQVLGCSGQRVTNFIIYPIYTANTYEIADVEVHL